MTRQSIALLFIVFVACAKENTATTDTVAAAPTATETTASAAPVPAEPVGSGACAFVTLAEVTTVMGHEMKFKQADNPAECVLVSASGDATKSVSFQVMQGTEAFTAMQTGQVQEELTGIGEKAVIGKTTNLVAAIKGGRTYLGGAYDASAPTTVHDKSIELAKKAVARM